MASESHRVVIIGAGFGGLFAARVLKNAPVSVTVIDRTNHHLFQPLLYQVATGILSEGDVAPPIRDVLRKYRNTEVLIGDVTSVDLDRRTMNVVNLGEDLEVGYDSLIVAAGAGQSYFGHPDFSQYAPGMKSIDDALEIRGRIFGAFEMAERETDPVKRREWLTFVIVGGGPTGVEMAGQIAELSHRRAPQLPPFRSRDGTRGPDRRRRRPDPGLRQTAVRQGPCRSAQARCRGASEQPGDERRRRRHRREGRTELHVSAQTKIWAAGVEASSLGKMLGDGSGAEVDRTGRVKVNPDFTLPGHPEVFLVGDMINLDKLPGVAEVAMQGGMHAARAIKKRVEAGDPNAKPFHYRNLGDMATISRFQAVASIGRSSSPGSSDG